MTLTKSAQGILFVAGFIVFVVVAREFSFRREWYIYPAGLLWLVVAVNMRHHGHVKRHESQTEKRRQIIRALYEESDDWDHMQLVLQHSGFKDPDGKEITIEQIKAEHAAMVLLDHDIQSEHR